MDGFICMSSTPGDPRWGYDDPSGLPDEVSVTLRLPEPLLDRVQDAARRTGATPAAWLLDLIDRHAAEAA